MEINRLTTLLGIFVTLDTYVALTVASKPYYFRKSTSNYVHSTIIDNKYNNELFCGSLCDEQTRALCVGFHTQENKCYLLKNEVSQSLTPREMFLADCKIELLSMGFDDPGFSHLYDGIKINGLTHNYVGFPRYGSNSFWRGLSIVVIGKQCLVTQRGKFDTYYSAGAVALNSFLSSLAEGTLIAGICTDECAKNIGPVFATLQNDFGVTVTGIRASIAFVALKGSPEKETVVRANRFGGPSALQSYFQRW